MAATVPRGTLEFEHELVEVTPIPVLARFVRPDNRVSGQTEVRGGVSARRVVTASGVTAFLADRRDGVLDQQRAVHRADPGSGAGWSPVNSSTAFWDARRWPAGGARTGALVMGPAPSGSGTGAPDGSGRHRQGRCAHTGGSPAVREPSHPPRSLPPAATT